MHLAGCGNAFPRKFPLTPGAHQARTDTGEQEQKNQPFVVEPQLACNRGRESRASTGRMEKREASGLHRAGKCTTAAIGAAPDPAESPASTDAAGKKKPNRLGLGFKFGGDGGT